MIGTLNSVKLKKGVIKLGISPFLSFNLVFVLQVRSISAVVSVQTFDHLHPHISSFFSYCPGGNFENKIAGERLSLFWKKNPNNQKP